MTHPSDWIGSILIHAWTVVFEKLGVDRRRRHRHKTSSHESPIIDPHGPTRVKFKSSNKVDQIFFFFKNHGLVPCCKK